VVQDCHYRPGKISRIGADAQYLAQAQGTEGLQADIRRRISKLREALQSGSKRAGRRLDIFYVPRMGAGQVALIGLPNTGKSSIVRALTGAPVRVADYPFSTDRPIPGMMRFEDIQIQLIDTPPITVDSAPPGLVNTFRGADLIAIVVDLSAGQIEQIDACLAYLRAHRLLAQGDEGPEDPVHRLTKKAFFLCTKADLAQPGTVDTLKEFYPMGMDFVETSVNTAQGLGDLGARLFALLDIVRIYAKPPGRPPDKEAPFILKAGSTVMDLAGLIHRELANRVKGARVWGTGVYPGQYVQLHHRLCDKDIVELHFD
jgi:ribosome-interacting GTPase 1